MKEKQDFEYSNKYRKLKQEKRERMFEDIKNTSDQVKRGAGNVRRGASNVGRGAQRVGSTISNLFTKNKPRPKSIYGKKKSWFKK